MDSQLPSDTLLATLRRRVGAALKDFETNEEAVVVTDELLTEDVRLLVKCAELLLESHGRVAGYYGGGKDLNKRISAAAQALRELEAQ